MRIISIDLGEISLGVAITDKTNTIATPLENYMFKREDYEQAANRVVEIVNEYDVTEILLGHPLRVDGTKSDATLMAENFFELLKQKLDNVNIRLFDERFTTKRGLEILEAKYKDPEELKKYKDMAAAFVMLQDYIQNL